MMEIKYLENPKVSVFIVNYLSIINVKEKKKRIKLTFFKKKKMW